MVHDGLGSRSFDGAECWLNQHAGGCVYGGRGSPGQALEAPPHIGVYFRSNSRLSIAAPAVSLVVSMWMRWTPILSIRIRTMP